ncbi:MAG TPA: YceI family protein [Methylomirabilota bacterium]|jgi:polyisoprenoid-binding protein YceI|nr:YceI family protein [Methylomirabilota bacterium]
MTTPQGSRSAANVLRIGVAVVVLAIVAAGAFGLWYIFLRPSGPAAVGDAALVVPSRAAATSSAGASSAATSSSASSSSDPLSGGIDGTWNVDTSIGSFSDFSDSFVGYRVQEQLANIGGNTAVGRTPAVSGSLTIAGTKVTATTIQADLTGLQSDDNRRDGQLSHQGLETSTFPTATFTLTSPIDLGSVPADGTEITVTATGTLTLHGQTKDVKIPLKAKLSGNTIVVTGSLEIAFADYGITKPNSFAVLSIADTGTLELQLFFTKA